MKSVLISIQPKWCELIASGKKTIEVRKTAPKDNEPFKVYIYQTKKKWIYKLLEKLGLYQGKVIGEFVCNKVKEFTPCAVRLCGLDYNICVSDFFATCLTDKELNRYGKNKVLYGWHIYNLKIYDEPKKLGEFRRLDTPFHSAKKTERGIVFSDGWTHGEAITRPPQSWCYVEAQ